MIVHVQPIYFCNYNCSYCYLGSLKKDPTYINLEKLELQLQEIGQRFTIDRVDVFGGEITLLPIDTIVEIIEICKKYSPKVTFVTNLSNPARASEIASRTGCVYATSINDERDYTANTLENLMYIDNRPNAIIQVATPSLMKKSPKEILDFAESLNVEFVGFIQYHPSETNPFTFPGHGPKDTPNRDYCNFLKSIIEEYFNGNYKIKIENIFNLEDCLNGKYLPWMDQEIFITPDNKYTGVFYINDNDVDPYRERFIEFEDLDDYDLSCDQEKMNMAHWCGHCEYFGHCYAEHLSKRQNYDDTCAGLKELMDWYGNFRKENLYKINERLQLEL